MNETYKVFMHKYVHARIEIYIQKLIPVVNRIELNMRKDVILLSYSAV